MVQRLQLRHPIEEVSAVASAEDILGCQKAVREVPVDAKVREYVVSIIHATRAHPAVQLGGSPRCTMALFRAAQSLAAIQGNPFVLPDDVKQIAPLVLTHRLLVRPESRLRKMTAAGAVKEILDQVPVPTGPAGGPVR